MAKFELKKNSVTLDICGNIFEVALTNEVIAACDRLKNDAAELLPKLKEANNSIEVVEGACKLLTSGIEGVLGEGSVYKIFGTNPITLFDLSDIVIYIRGEIAAVVQKKAQAYRGKK